MTRPLGRLFPADADDAAQSRALDRFLCTILDPRPDGVRHHRIVEDGEERARIFGEMWNIDQTTDVFWLDVRRAEDGALAWTLSVGLVASERRARNAVHSIMAPEEERWRTRTSGRFDR